MLGVILQDTMMMVVMRSGGGRGVGVGNKRRLCWQGVLLCTHKHLNENMITASSDNTTTTTTIADSTNKPADSYTPAAAVLYKPSAAYTPPRYTPTATYTTATPYTNNTFYYTPAAPVCKPALYKTGGVGVGVVVWSRNLSTTTTTTNKNSGGEDGDSSHTLSSSTVTISSVTMDNDTARIQVEWEGEGKGGVTEYPCVWLRDNCLCPDCYHSGTSSRTHTIIDLHPDPRPRSLKVTGEGEGVEVKWEDGHTGTYPAHWLHQRTFNKDTRTARHQLIRMERKYWDSCLLKDVPHVHFPDLMTSDAALLTWLEALEEYGFVVIREAPAEEGQVRRLTERVAFVKKTHYGEEFSVVAKPDPSNVAYLSGPLQLHADLPYYIYKPGVQLIHCIHQYEGEGAESQVTDAVKVARDLSDSHPHHYHALTTTPVDWWDVGCDKTGPFFKVLRLPMICTNADGEIERINVSQPQRDSHFSVDVDLVAPWYKAMLVYHAMLTHPKYCIQFKMEPGTILSLDNLRIVHGRTAYGQQKQRGESPGQQQQQQQQESGSDKVKRHLEGCYIDWDEVRSRRRVLQCQLTSPSTC